ncbi:MAG: leucine-rich repeat protein [Methanobrevibacter sp.]|nr:leucine-rich repeat protein [Methanobrevibacter sp.]
MSYARKLLIDGVEIADVIIPDTIDEIKPFTFYRCYSLSNIVLSTNLMSINDESFSDCIGLSTVEIPSHVSSIS